MKLVRTIRLDDSDPRVFPLVAEPGEWAVTGSFAFADADPDSLAALPGKERLAFASGWLGLGTFGRSTLVQVASIREEEYEAAVLSLAAHLFADYGAPDMLAALAAAKGEVAHAAGLADHDVGTLLAIERELSDRGIRERIRIVSGARGQHARIWTVVEDD
jgi:hypothetical protein